MAIDIFFSTGALMNLLERATVELDSGTADAAFPLSNLWDGRPNRPLRFASPLSTANVFLIDLNALAGGDFETFPFSGWTVDPGAGNGTVTQTTTGGEFHAGLAAAKLAGGSFGVAFYKDITVRAGEARKLTVWLKGGGVGQPAQIDVQDKKTGRFLTSGGAWQATYTTTFSQTSSTYAENTVTYTTESLFKVGEGTTTLRIRAVCDAGDTVFVDDFYDWPAVDVLSLHGLKIQDRDIVEWKTSSDGITYGDSQTAGNHDTGYLDDQKPNVYLKRASRNYLRYHLVQLDPSSVEPYESREVGEMVMAQLETLARNPDWGFEVRVLFEDATNETNDGSQQTYNRSRWPRRIMAVDTNFISDAQMRQARDELFGRARGRQYPILMIPDSTANLVMLVHTDDSWSVRRKFTSFYGENSQTYAELPFVTAAL